MSFLLSSEVPVNKGGITTDCDCNAYKGHRDAQLQITGKTITDVIQVKEKAQQVRENEFQPANV